MIKNIGKSVIRGTLSTAEQVSLLSDIILHDHNMWCVAVSDLIGAEHMKRYPVNFGPKGYPNKKHAGV